jgi:hypothetical protein
MSPCDWSASVSPSTADPKHHQAPTQRRSATRCKSRSQDRAAESYPFGTQATAAAQGTMLLLREAIRHYLGDARPAIAMVGRPPSRIRSPLGAVLRSDRPRAGRRGRMQRPLAHRHNGAAAAHGWVSRPAVTLPSYISPDGRRARIRRTPKSTEPAKWQTLSQSRRPDSNRGPLHYESSAGVGL